MSHAERIVRDAAETGRLPRREAEWLAARLADPSVREPLCEAARETKQRAHGARVTVSPNVFIPLTNLCRDRCAYCTFAKTPDSPEAHTYTPDEVAAAVRGGVATGCIEALFCLGDKPEIAYRAYRDWLRGEGFGSTAAYLEAGCRVALEGGLLPHTNAGILTAEEMARLRHVNASMGLMLESTSPRLRGRGMAHQYAPDKDPAVRIRMHEEAGELSIPFTTGILLGIGEDAAERIDTLLEIRRLHERWGHVQEAIVQPFHPKPGTRMRAALPLTDDEVVGWIALARLLLPAEVHLQAPPNLAGDPGGGMLERLLGAGVDDWGGVSPVTVDFINPEAPWPALRELRRRTEAAGARLAFRLPVYPEHLRRPEFFEPAVRERALAFADEEGLARPRQALEAA
ncbi:MAG: 7,8-didemethyl-8-hydroxy-5-deazariboflavin synthase CofG [Myxococcota bacterium]|nr:7,8-didemethyl-8-hydroxy-5-deazariboflavin synthase CofG [Myxococcota bacterium]